MAQFLSLYKNVLKKEVFSTKFVEIRTEKTKGGWTIYPSFQYRPKSDIMVRGGAFYAIWNEETGLWSTNEYDVITMVDNELRLALKDFRASNELEGVSSVRYLSDFSSGSFSEFRRFTSNYPDSFRNLDSSVTFLSQKTTIDDYASKRLPYDLVDGPCPAWEELVSALYSPEEREKIEWAIGSILAGDSSLIQKFYVFYGEPGSGKSTIINVIEKLFEGYYKACVIGDLVSKGNAFALDSFGTNPLIAIDHDADLSGIETNVRLNSMVSHEIMKVNEKYKTPYDLRFNTTIFVGTNKPVKITDAKSGLNRRLIDINPTGVRIPAIRYLELTSQISFELGQIANHCLQVYKSLGIHHYDRYIPFQMIEKTNQFFNFVEENYFDFSEKDWVTLKMAYSMYKKYCEDTNASYILQMYKFREELKDYFLEYKDRIHIGDQWYRKVYFGFRKDKFSIGYQEEEEVLESSTIELINQPSIFDEIAKDWPAQYANEDGTPMWKWANCTTTLKDLDTSRLHYVKLPENHIVIDFDLKNEKGEKDEKLNLGEASKWPLTYTEVSKGGSGLHLHYIYDGNASDLNPLFKPGIEVKSFHGGSSLRRKLTRCNNLPISTISGGLPKKEVKSTVNDDIVTTEKGIRTLIKNNLNKKYHPATTPSVQFIYKILEDAYNSGVEYDVTDLRPSVLSFASHSTHQAGLCISLVGKMKFKSKDEEVSKRNSEEEQYESDEFVFFDCEVFPNLFLINWKYAGEAKKCVRMINPSPEEVERLFKMKLIGFNCRRYDNHILYARSLGYSNMELFKLSSMITAHDKKSSDKNCFFREAYNLSYTDVYDFASAPHKQSLKKWEIDLGIHHQELGLPWDKPVPEDKWEQVAEYCDNDVISTEAVFNHLSGDWAARKILAQLSGGTYNDTTNSLSTKFIFGSNRSPQSNFLYRDLSKPVYAIDQEVRDYLERNTPMDLSSKFVPPERNEEGPFEESILPYFPGYKFENGKSTYRGFTVGEGGYVSSLPGMYWNIGLLDVASMHPSSIEDECLFGPYYTQRFSEIKRARIFIKREDRASLEKILDGRLVKFYDEAVNGGEFTLEDLSTAIKTVINSVYGLTSASFDNAFRDRRNIDNIVAKRGALFMIDLYYEIIKRGFKVAHIKTDSIKIPDATPEIISFVQEFGRMYGYEFELESTYDRMCLVNKAVYICFVKSGKHAGTWQATGTQFARPNVLKTLFTKKPLEFADYCETKSVTSSDSAIYLDMNEGDEENHDYHFVGRVGSFCPVLEGTGGGLLVAKRGDKYDGLSGTVGYRWLEAEAVKALGYEDKINFDYYQKEIDEAIAAINKYGDFESFVSGVRLSTPPWCDKNSSCDSCPDKDLCKENIF